jgi:hypothetical protein
MERRDAHRTDERHLYEFQYKVQLLLLGLTFVSKRLVPVISITSIDSGASDTELASAL